MINNCVPAALQWAWIKRHVNQPREPVSCLKNNKQTKNVHDEQIAWWWNTKHCYRTRMWVNISSINYTAVGNLSKSNRLDIKSAFVNPLCKHQAVCSAFTLIKVIVNTKFKFDQSWQDTREVFGSGFWFLVLEFYWRKEFDSLLQRLGEKNEKKWHNVWYPKC